MTREQMRKIPIPIRGWEVSSNWVGLNHGFLADCVVNRIIANGAQVLHEYWYVNKAFTALHGVVTIDWVPDIIPELAIPPNLTFQLGVRHSNDSKLALGFVAGGIVQVCSNGMFIGECQHKRKHTTDVDIDGTVDIVLSQYRLLAMSVYPFIDTLQKIELTDAEVHDFIFKSYFDEQAMAFKNIEDIYNEWRRPSYEDFRPRTAWSLFNAYTNAIKFMLVPRQYDAHVKVKELFDRLIIRKRMQP